MIHVYEPDLSGRERAYLLDAFDSTWISSRGAYLDRFERALADYTGIAHAAAVTNGTVALHLALHCLDLQPGDEVIVPSFTYIASVNAIVMAGGLPVFAECGAGDWQLDPDDVERRITPRTRAILPVHLYGGACDMDRLCALAAPRGLAMIEDCAEALGTFYKGRHVGGFGTAATFSFFGNKTVTTGEGGAIACNDPERFRRMVIVKGQGQDPDRRYWHVELGYNYRMTNLAAAIGVAQFERIGSILERKRRIAQRYRRNLDGSGVRFPDTPQHVEGSNWLVSLLVPEGADRDSVMKRMEGDGIETRPVFHCAHHMPPHARPDLRLPISAEIAARGVSLPSYPELTDGQVDQVSESLARALKNLEA